MTKRSASQGPRVEFRAPLNVIAAFDDMESARAAMEALGTTGIDGGRISLTGPGAREAAERPELMEADTKLLRHVAVRAIEVSAAAAAVCALLGVAAGVLILPSIDTTTSLANLALCLALGALLGSILGALVGGISSLQPAEAWALTFEESAEGGVFVGVHTEDDEEADRAEKILTERAKRVRRFGSRVC